MKTIGLLGGMSWESTLTYYRVVNETVRDQLGGLHSAKCVLYSVDFDEIERCQSAGDWARSGEILADASRALERAGAQLLVLCTNTMHKVAGDLEAAVDIPLLHIASATARVLQAQGVDRVGLLGTRYTMEQDFYTGKLREHGLETLIPGEPERELVNRVIFDELCRGMVLPESRRAFLEIIGELSGRGAGAVILGCTEIGLLVSQEDTPVPLCDTALLHARQAALWALED